MRSPYEEDAKVDIEDGGECNVSVRLDFGGQEEGREESRQEEIGKTNHMQNCEQDNDRERVDGGISDGDSMCVP